MNTFYSKTLKKNVTIPGNDPEEDWNNWINHVESTYEQAAKELANQGFSRHESPIVGCPDYFTKNTDGDEKTVKLYRRLGSDKWLLDDH